MGGDHMITLWEERVTPSGLRYRKAVRPEMPRIPADYVDCVVFLYQSLPAAEQRKGQAGCGFLVGVRFREVPARVHMYVVANAHVANDDPKCRVVRLNSTARNERMHDLTEATWIAPRDGCDIAVASLGTDTFLDDRMSVLLPETFLTQEQMGSIPLRHGDELFMASHYVGHPGEEYNEPMVRFGTLAHPRPVPVKYPDSRQECFLAEMKSFSGHSGSPVFLYYHDQQARLGADPAGSEPKAAIRLLGIDQCHLPVMTPIVMTEDPRKIVSELIGVQQNSDFTGIIPAWRIAELLGSDHFVRERTEIEDSLTRPSKWSTMAVPDRSPRLIGAEWA